MDVDGALLGLTLQVDVEYIVVLGVGKDLSSVESHDVIGDRFDRFGREVHIVNSQVSIIVRTIGAKEDKRRKLASS